MHRNKVVFPVIPSANFDPIATFNDRKNMSTLLDENCTTTNMKKNGENSFKCSGKKILI